MALIEYFSDGDLTYIFCIRPDLDEPLLDTVTLPQEELRRFVLTTFAGHSQLADLLEMGGEELWHRYDYLAAPLAHWTEPDDVIYLVPYGLLHYLPLHALRIEGRYLVERNPVVYSPSASLLKYCRDRKKLDSRGRSARRTAAVFGDSRGDLPFAREEAAAVAILLGTSAMIGPEVTQETFVRASADVDIVHFAGHSFFHPQEPLESGLIMAGDDVLTAREVFAFESLHASLVTLSGCETGVNENRPGDELIGLTRAFLFSGTPSIVVSLWEVADDSTGFLMTTFYRLLRQQPALSTVDALRQAILDTKHRPQWASLYHWAPFILAGDWQ